jgi:hypothetical protein
MHAERRVLSSLDIRYRARKGTQEEQLWHQLAHGLEPFSSRCKCDYVEARTLQYLSQGIAARGIRFDDYNSLQSVAHLLRLSSPAAMHLGRFAVRWGFHLTMTTFDRRKIRRKCRRREAVEENPILAAARRC